MNQVLSVPGSGDLTNVVYMGMGEPLDNLPAVLDSIEVLTAKWGLGWSPKRITVSSIGKLCELKRLLDETKVHVAISIHSPFPSERASLMPVGGEAALPPAFLPITLCASPEDAQAGEDDGLHCREEPVLG